MVITIGKIDKGCLQIEATTVEVQHAFDYMKTRRTSFESVNPSVEFEGRIYQATIGAQDEEAQIVIRLNSAIDIERIAAKMAAQ